MTDFNREELKDKTLAEFKPIKKLAPDAPREEYNEADEESLFNKFKLIVPIIFIAIICFVGYAWYTDKFAISNSNGELPIVKANKNPLREKPEDPGGLKIVNRDKKVFDTISGAGSDKEAKEANILPPPEEPIAHNKIANADDPSTLSKIITESKGTPTKDNEAEKADNSDSANAIQASSTNETTNTKQETKQSTEAEPAATNTSKPKEEEKPSPAVVAQVAKEPVKTEINSQVQTKPKETVPSKQEIKPVTTDDVKDVEPKKKPAPQKKPVKAASNYRIQLGSYRSTGDAEVSWKMLKKKFPDILDGLNDYIEKADLGDKGIFYRLQLSGFANESDARKVCQKLTEKKQGCFFVGK